MKKVYRKPEVLFENFSLSIGIAVNCEEINKNPSVDQCSWTPDEQWDFGGIFGVDYQGACEVTPSNSGYDTLCYHVPSENYNLFTS